MRMIRNRTARRIRFHSAWLAVLFMLLDALANVWSTFDGIFPIAPAVYAGLGLLFAVASGIGHLLIFKDI